MTPSLPETTREIRLAARPHGWPELTDFELAETAVPEPGEGEVLVANEVMSVDPYMRGRMNDVKSYVPPFQLGQVLQGGAVGEVVRVGGGVTSVSVGDHVLHNGGWREHACIRAEHAQRVDTDLAPAGAYLGVLGMPGLTAYAGLTRIAAMQEGDVVFVSGAAGAVGGMVGQIAKRRGASRVVGSAGSLAKVSYLRDELGFDAAFDYHDGHLREHLREAAPDGIDVYFDNVGGAHLEAAIGALRPHGRAALCGAISQYNATEPTPGPRNMALMIGNKLTLRGFIVSDHQDLAEEFHREFAPLVGSGEISYRETVVDGGVEAAPGAFIELLRGANVGKMLVRF